MYDNWTKGYINEILVYKTNNKQKKKQFKIPVRNERCNKINLFENNENPF